MSHHACQVVGDVYFREGDGPELPVPRGPCAVEVTELDATLTWTEGASRGAAAIPLGEFRRFVDSGALLVVDEARP